VTLELNMLSGCRHRGAPAEINEQAEGAAHDQPDNPIQRDEALR
jgi:hypothetical protein